MIQVSSGRTAHAGSQLNARWRFVRLLSGDPLTMTMAILMLAGCLNIASSAHAQTATDPASCLENCDKEQAKCPELGTTEEMCEYDYKQCKKACEGK